MSRSAVSDIQKVLLCTQAISDVCREDKHAFLKDACAYSQQQFSGVMSADKKANVLFYPFRIAATLQSRSEQRIFAHAAQGITALLLTQLVSASTRYAPPSVPRTERKLGFFSTRDVSTPQVSMQSLDTVDSAAAEESSLVDIIIATIELRTTIFRGENGFVVHTPAENTVFMEHLKSLSLLMRERRFGVHGKRWLHCFQIALVCCGELRPLESRNDAPLREVFPSILMTLLRRTRVAVTDTAVRSGEDLATLDGVEKSSDDGLADARLCVALLDLLCTKEARDAGSRNDPLLSHLSLIIRLRLMAFYFDEASTSLCRWPSFMQLVSRKVCPYILHGIVSKDPEIYTQSLFVLQNIMCRHGTLLKSKAVYFVLGVLVPLLEADITAAEKKEEMLNFLRRVLRHPAVLAEWFVNFDCLVGAPSMVEQLVRKLGKLRILRGDTSPNKKLTRALYEVFFTFAQSMRALLNLKDDESGEVSPVVSPLVGQPPSELDSSALMLKMLEQKKRYKAGVALFNEARQYETAIDTLAKINGLMDNRSPYAVAQFLMTCEDLNPAEIGNFLSRPDAETTSVMKAYIDLHDFSGMTIDEAVRLFMSSFRIAGEAETVDRTMEAFSEVYCQQNPNTVSKAAACVLAFSVVMLNTDAHSSQVKHKMTQEQYVSNLRGTNEGKDFPTNFLVDIYKRVTRQEIKPWKQFPAYVVVTRVMTGSHAEVHLSANAVELITKDVRTEKYVESTHISAVAGAICDCTWNTFLPAFSFPLEESSERGIIDACLKGFADCITVMCCQGRRSELRAFLSALRAFSHLTGLRTMEYKNVRAVALLIQVAHEYPNELMDVWEEVIRSISWIGRLAAVELLTDRHKSDEDGALATFPDVVPTAARRGANVNGNESNSGGLAAPAAGAASGGGGGLPRMGSRQRVDFMAADTIEATGRENAAILFQHISKDAIHSLFTRSDKLLRGDGLLAMVRCLCKICSEETASHPPSTFSFRYLVDVLEVNFHRKLSVWRELWGMASNQIHLIFTVSKSQSQSIFAFKVLRRFTVAQLEDKEISSDAAMVSSIFDLYQSLTERCEFLPVMESLVFTLARYVRVYPRRLGGSWLAVLSSLMNCFERLPDMRIAVAATLHEVSSRCFLVLYSHHHECVEKLLRMWGTVARIDPSLEKYALLHIRLLISFLLCVENRRSLRHAQRVLRCEKLEDELPAPTPPGAVRPSIPVLNKAIRFLDEDASTAAPSSAWVTGGDGGLPSFGLCMMGFAELASLAADFHARQSLTEFALDSLMDATAAFRARAKLRTVFLNGPSRQRALRVQGQWEQLYSHCVLDLVDVYVGVCLCPCAAASSAPVAAAPAGVKRTPPLAPSPAPSLPSPERKMTVLVRAPRGAVGEAGRSPPTKSSSTPGTATPSSQVKRTAEEVSDLSLGLLEKLVSLLVKQELIIREEEEGNEDGEGPDDGSEDGVNLAMDEDMDAPLPLRPASSLLPSMASSPVVAETAAAELLLDGYLTEESRLSPTLPAVASRQTLPSPPLGGTLSPGESVARGGGGGGGTRQGSPRTEVDVEEGAREEEEEENVLDEARRDEVEEVNLNLVERLLGGLCLCGHEKIRDLGFRAVRKLIASRLECAVTVTDQAEMAGLAKRLNDSLQTFFHEHVVTPCLLPQQQPTAPAEIAGSGAVARAGEAEDVLIARQCGNSASSGDDVVRLPSEAALRACINYIDLLAMVMQQEVPVGQAEGVVPNEEHGHNSQGPFSICPPDPFPPPEQQVYEGLLDDATTASILQDFRENYVASSRVLSLDYFSTLNEKDGLSRAAGERVLAMLITFECSISNVFIEMEVSRDPVTASQLASPSISMMTSPSRTGFGATFTHQPQVFGGSSDAALGIRAVLTSTLEHGVGSPMAVAPSSSAAHLTTELGSSIQGTSSGIRSAIQVQVEQFRNFVLNAFLEASRESKRVHASSPAVTAAATANSTNTSSMANQQQLLATRTVVRSFLESLQRAPRKVVHRLVPKYHSELCELIKSCDEEISPILSDIFLRYFSNI